MSRRPNLNPPLQWDAHARQFFVVIKGDKKRLGANRAEAEERRKRLVGEWLLGGEAPKSPPPKARAAARLSVTEALLAYRKAVAPRLSESQLERIDRAARAARSLFAALPADEFDQLRLQEVRGALLATQYVRTGKVVDRIRELLANGPVPAAEFNKALRGEGYSASSVWQARRRLGVVGERKGRKSVVSPPPGGFKPLAPTPLSRKYVNALVGVLQRAWKWMASQKIVPGELSRDLYTVSPLKEGESGRETAPVLPADAAAVEATLPRLNRVVRAMVEVHRLTGMRPAEVCRLRRCDISTSPGEKVWMPLPDGKKAAVSAVEVDGVAYWVYAPPKHKTRGKRKWRAVVIPPAAQEWLKPFFDGRPPDAYLFNPREASDELREGRGQRKRYGRGRSPGAFYTTHSYHEAVQRAARAAGVAPWNPAALRHSVASAALEVGRDDEVSALLGHASTDLISTYAAQAVQKAAALAARLG